MKFSRSRLALLALLCGTSLVHADILILKNGNKVEGNILSESPTAVRMKYRLTPKIWDEKDFPMSDIQQVIKQRPEEVEIIELRKVLPTADLLTADKYEQIIQDRLRPFVNKYPGTPEAKEAEGLIATLQEEKTRVSNGEAKLEGRWLTATETKGEQFNIEAYRLLTEMREQMAKNEWVEALRVFDRFTKNKPGYLASTYYPQAITEALTCLDKWEVILSRMAQEQPALQKQRDEGLKKLNDTDQARTKAAIEEEKTKWRAQSDAEKRSQVRWIEPYKYDLPSILAMQKVVVGERTRLQALNLDDMRTKNETLVAVYRKIGEGDYTGGAAAYERVSSLSSTQEYRDVVADLKSRLMRLYGELVRKQATTQSVTSGSAAMGGTATASVDDRVAKILAEAGGQTAPAAAGTAPAAGAPQAAAPAAAGTAPAPAAAVPAAPAPATAIAPAAPAPMVPAAPAYVPPPQEESNLQTYIIAGMGALLLLLVALLFQKKKQS